MKIAVIDNGFVFVTRGYTEAGDRVTLTNARCIRVWGTTDGLGQLATGPQKDTALDAMIPIVEIPIGRIVFTFDVTGWDEHL